MKLGTTRTAVALLASGRTATVEVIPNGWWTLPAARGATGRRPTRR